MRCASSKPCAKLENPGKSAELTGLDRKVVDKTMTAMKKDESMVENAWTECDKYSKKSFYAAMVPLIAAVCSIIVMVEVSNNALPTIEEPCRI